MPLTSNMAIGFTGAAVPTGWSRVTELDARYIRGAATGADSDLITSRGASTHTHTSPAHAPTQQPHTHAFGDSGSTASNVVLSSATTGTSVPTAFHDHQVVNSDATTGINDSVAITVDAASNELSYCEVVWIKPSADTTTLPSGSFVFYSNSSFPTGFHQVQDTKGHYLKGSPTNTFPSTHLVTGGSNTHSHTSPTHTHTQQPHSHTGTSGTTTLGARRGTGTVSVASITHTHSVTLTSTVDSIVGGILTAPVNLPTTTTIDSSNHEPPFRDLYPIESDTNIATTLPDQSICMWLGKHVDIPTAWARYTAMDGMFVSSPQGNASTGGSSTHTHTASDCTPLQYDHAHPTIVDNGSTGTNTTANTGIAQKAGSGHTHSGWVSDYSSVFNNSCTVTINACSSGDAFPLHRTVIFIQYNSAQDVKKSCYTSYDYNEWDAGVGLESTPRDPAVQQKVWSRDWRYR